MSFLSRLFGQGSEGGGSPDVEAELARLEAEADRAAPGYVGSAHNRAGDLALRSGQPERAVGYYGRAIDAFLLDAQREAARGVANKIIRVRPAAVRTLCTLTWLDLAARHRATALLHLRDYVEAARDAGEVGRAATEIYAMARLAPDTEFGNAVADALDGFDYPGRAREVRGWVDTGAPDAVDDPAELSAACLAAAVASTVLEDLLERVPDEPSTESDGREAEETIGSEVDASGEADLLDAEALDLAEAGDAATGAPDEETPGNSGKVRPKKSKKRRKRKKKRRSD